MTMYYLSQLLNLPVLDRSGEKVATVVDLISRFGQYYPALIGMVARSRRRNFFIVWNQQVEIRDRAIQISTFKLDLQPFARRAGEIMLARDLLDKQIIDINGRRVVRVNDVQLATMRQGLRVVGVDVSFRGLLRRLIPQKILPEERLPEVIDWANVEYLATETNVKLNVSHERIAKLHPVEIAKLVEALSYKQEAEILRALEPDKAADALEEMSIERQAEIINRMTEEQAAEILDHMEPDEAADLLADLSAEKAEELLDRMSPEESEDVRELLAYEENTAGGIMTNQFVSISVQLTVGEAITYLRELAEQPDLLHDIYLIDNEANERLVGLVSLRDLMMAKPEVKLAEIMKTDLPSIDPASEALQAVRTIAEYNLLTIPVLDQSRRLLGIITVDDAIALLLPERD